MITKEREEFYSSERSEWHRYESAGLGAMVTVPLTRDGFEALCQRVVREHNLILDDGIRSLVAGYIHHIPSNQITFDLSDLCCVAYKTLSNNLTYVIDQEAKQRAAAVLKQDNVIPIHKEEPQPTA